LRAVDYVPVRSVEEAVAVLAEHGDRAAPLAGGTDLIAQLKEGHRSIDLIVDVKPIPELMELSYDPAAGLWIGGAVPCHRISRSQVVRRHYPALLDSTTLIGGIQIQGRASLGGNVCNASPAADSVPNLIAHSATCHVAGPQGTRTIPLEAFFVGPGQTVLRPGEFLVGFRLPVPPAHFGAAYLRFIPRNEMDIAVVGAGASVVLSPDGQTVQAARIALGAVAPTPLYVPEAGQALVGQPVTEESIARAAQIARDAARPITDMRGTVAQRKHLAGVLTARALRIAIDRARGTKTVDSLGRLNGHA